jgi:hypothetical protein
MVSMFPNNESRDIKFMYDLPDLRYSSRYGKPNITKKICDNTVLGFINNNKHLFSKFLKIIQISEMENLFMQNEFNKTLFLPLNDGISDDIMDNLDPNLAKAIINFSLFFRIIDKNLLVSSPAYYLMSSYKPLPRLLITNIDHNIELNGCATIINYNIKLNNGLIHILDKVLIPRVIL